MAGFKLSERIQASPQDVFTFLTDVENAAKMLPAVNKTEKLGTKALDVGTRYIQVRQFAGHEYTSEYEVTEFEPPVSYVVSGAQEGIRATYAYRLEPVGGSTLIQLECKVSGEGFNKVLAWFVAGAMQRDDANILVKLRQAFEAGSNS